ncbi:MAG: VacJ family lipoprotein, partial [Desulfosarcinaceae bacterium]
MRRLQSPSPAAAGLCLLVGFSLLITGGCASGPNGLDAGPLSLSMMDPAPSVREIPLLTQNAEEEEDWEEEEWEDEEWEEEEDAAAIADPLMPYNKVMFHINDNLYYGVLRPVGAAYRFLVPLPIRSGLKNFFTNLAFPVRFLNCLLQGKGEAAEREIDRFALNTVVGVLGFGDPAKNYPQLDLNEEDFGQTLGVWGAGHGIYIVLPILGPSTLRDSVGLLGDLLATPATYLLSTERSLALTAGERVNTLSFHIGDYESFKDMAFDPYSAFRDAYLQ